MAIQIEHHCRIHVGAPAVEGRFRQPASEAGDDEVAEAELDHGAGMPFLSSHRNESFFRVYGAKVRLYRLRVLFVRHSPGSKPEELVSAVY